MILTSNTTHSVGLAPEGIGRSKAGESMRITTKGQVTIPQDIREDLGLLPHTEVQFVREGERVYLQKVPAQPDRGTLLVQHLRGKGTVNMTTDEIMALTRGE